MPVGQLDQAEAVDALDNDVQPPVVEVLQHLHDGGARPDLPQTVLVGEDEAELVARLQALADQLAIPGLEDVERALLSRKEHQFEREETDLVHAQRVDAVAGTE